MYLMLTQRKVSGWRPKDVNYAKPNSLSLKESITADGEAGDAERSDLKMNVFWAKLVRRSTEFETDATWSLITMNFWMRTKAF